MPKILLVANPSARGGAARAHIAPVLVSLRDFGHEVELLETRPATPVSGQVSEALAKGADVEVVAVMGGDGTFREVACGVLETPAPRPPMALIPAGTANNHGKTLGLPSVYESLSGALSPMLRPLSTLWIDMGWLSVLDDAGVECESWRFFDSVGWGWQADILHRRLRLLESSLGVRLPGMMKGESGYGLAAIQEFFLLFFASLSFDAEVWIDDECFRVEGLLDLIVSASFWYGGRWILDPDACSDDGLFELVLFQGIRELALKGFRDLDALGSFGRKLLARLSASTNRQGSHFALRLDRKQPLCSQVDGEPGPTGWRFSVRVEARALELARGENKQV